MQEGIWGWSVVDLKWVRAAVDVDGHLQVDVLEAPLPTNAATETTLALIEDAVDGIEALLAGGLPSVLDTDSLKVIEQSPITGFATAANQVITQGYIDGIETLLGAGLPVALDTLALKVREQGTPKVLCQGWNGAAWQNLLVEDATNYNLRVALYSGANLLYSIAYNKLGWTIATPTMLGVAAFQCLSDGATSMLPAYAARYLGDNNAGTYIPPAALWAWDGSNWDRLRSYGTGILKVGRAEVGLLTVRKTAVGQVGAAGARKLYWMNCNPSASLSVFELTDAAAPGGTVVLDHFDTTRDGHMLTFDPPMEFATGIYLETFTNITSITFGYL